MTAVEINGHCDERFARVGSAFTENFEKGLEVGASFALAIEGEFVVDLWAGHADLARTRPWREDTIVTLHSTSKIATSLCGLMLVDRGLIDLDAPVARYWPEFAAAGKEELPVRHIFCHASGVAGFDPPIHWTDLLDWEGAVERLAAQAPWWEPGTRSGYHALTFYFLIGELIRRTTGLTPDRFFREEVANVIGADMQIGLADADIERLAETQPIERPHDKSSFSYRVAGMLLSDGHPGDDPRWRKALVNGYGNAKSVAKVGSVLASSGSLYGHEFMSKQTAQLAYQEQIYTHDPWFDAPVRLGLGFGLASKEIPLPFPNSFHWGGAGGSMVVMEPDSKACWCYVPNGMGMDVGLDERGMRLAAAAALSVKALAD